MTATMRGYSPGSYTPAIGEQVGVVEYHRRGDSVRVTEQAGTVTACTAERVTIDAFPSASDVPELITYDRGAVVVHPGRFADV